MLIRRAIVGGGGWAPPQPLPPGWTPSDISGILDWGIYSDTSRLKQNTAGTTAVTATGQSVRWWRGQRDVLTLIVSFGSTPPTYESGGITASFAGSYLTVFSAAYTIAQSANKFLAVAADSTGSGELFVGASPSSNRNQGTYITNKGRSVIRAGSASIQDATPYSYVIDQGGTTAKVYGADTANDYAPANIGTATGNCITLDAQFSGSSAGSITAKGWAFGTSAISAQDAFWLAQYLNDL